MDSLTLECVQVFLNLKNETTQVLLSLPGNFFTLIYIFFEFSSFSFAKKVSALMPIPKSGFGLKLLNTSNHAIEVTPISALACLSIDEI